VGRRGSRIWQVIQLIFQSIDSSWAIESKTCNWQTVSIDKLIKIS